MVKVIHSEVDTKLKAKMPDGIWQSEPDYQHWVDETTNLDCLIVRNESGGLCGYVGVGKKHAFYGRDYSSCVLPEARLRTPEEVRENTAWLEESPMKGMENFVIERSSIQHICSEGDYCSHTLQSILRVHGGITYTNECKGKICHKTETGDHVWWIGFDCVHGGDLSPTTIEWNKKFHDSWIIKHPEYADIPDYHEQDVYRDLDYVISECERLALQIKEYENKNS